ncbi:RNA polymerase sigma-I factor [Bacillus solitudinis]|uniref:RNA polymerase sigma-I factor n=1 Tax=Bacillus solitudinis TaxID=2014074 RepID=UPI000C2503E4|nr:RNA polymerase sigma-I factor [Bacillus solitudinis]
MEENDLETKFIQARQGNNFARERLINHYKPYMINVAGHISKRYISWSDEEASISLLAFNRAIDTFKENSGRTFLNYVYLLIQRDLIDYYRKEQREQHFSLDSTKDNEESNSTIQEQTKALESYEREVQTTELVEEILEFDQILRNYNITFEELEDYSPKHEDSRLALFQIAAFCSCDKECLSLLQRKKKLPITLISKKLGTKKKTLDRHRKYLITLILLQLHPQWEHLSQFIRKEQS